MNDMSQPKSNFMNAALLAQPETIALRRSIHEEPELGLHTSKTLAKVKASLAGLPLTIREAKSCSGMIAILEGAKPGRTVLLRGDMDALPMPEDADVSFRSQVEGVMHACGHDAHAAMLASAARILCAERENLAGRVVFMFQPGEEGYHGARFMIEDGLLDDPKPDAAFALHISPNMPVGLVSSRAGTLLASAEEFEIVVRGKGGHASMPHMAVDPVPAACEIVLALQSFVARQVDVNGPAVISVSMINGGTATNVIPETVKLGGTIRTLSENTHKLVHEGMNRIVENVARAHGCAGELSIPEGHPLTVNDPRAADLFQKTTHALFGEGTYFPMPFAAMGAEDFSYVLQKIPGAMAFLGVCPEGQDFHSACPCHSNRMELNEAAMAHGVALHCAIAERFLSNGFES